MHFFKVFTSENSSIINNTKELAKLFVEYFLIYLGRQVLIADRFGRKLVINHHPIR